MWLCAQAAEFYDVGIQNLLPRLNKWLGKGDDYVEKLLNVCVKDLLLVKFNVLLTVHHAMILGNCPT